ncbi:MAG: von Willebrand factor type A domain-containing protein [Planctomycetaceae bacterium]|jgi:Ca-activated chloride channel family protein|nr:von Willebrand factor type A domain-containing protein [Planctomycetaceae bacterium]
MNLIKSDPRLTSFVLGELSETETNELQTAINADPKLQTEIESIRQTIKEIEIAMKNEPLPEKLNVIPKRKKWFMRIAAATVALSLLIIGVAVSTFITAFITGKIGVVIADKNRIATMAVTDQQEVTIPTNEPEMSRKTVSNQNFVGENAKTKNDESLREERHIKFVDSLMQTERAYIPTDNSTPVTLTPPIGMPAYIPTDNSTPVTLTPPKGIPAPIGDNRASGKTLEISGNVSGTADDGFGRPGHIGGKDTQITAQMSRPFIDPLQDSSFSVKRESEFIGEISPVVVTNDNDLKKDPYNSGNDETYKNTVENEFKPVTTGEFSTFSIDVDTASYTTMRRYLNETGTCPPADSVRIEEYINYFKYNYAPPTDGKPFATYIDVSPCPWESKHLLARIGIKGKEYNTEERPALNLVFLIDVSGSMSASNRLPLVQRGLTELVEMLQPKDRVAIVTYAGTSRVALPSVSGQEKRAILDSINGLGAGGSTAGAAGIKTAYETARKYYDKKAQNRVILCTDGDFNVGETNNKTLEEMIADEAKSGVFLTILGFGMGNYKDERLKILSMRGNGNYGYIDTPEEARRLLVESLTGTLFAIAKDVKIQVDFNPAAVAGYRLIGYENRKLRDEDFHNDKIDAGEIGAGHTVTALYEIVPVNENVPATVDKSRYSKETPVIPDADVPADNTKSVTKDSAKSEELMFVKLRYKLPEENKSSLLEYPVSAVSKEMSGDSQFAAAVALFGMLLRESRYSGNGNYDSVLELATPNTNDNQYRKEFIELVKKAKAKN